MKMKTIAISRRMVGALCIFAALVFVLGAGHSASAQGWASDQPKYAYLDFNTSYLYQDSSDYYHFSTEVGGSSQTAFWESAELIEMAEDGYVWAETNDTADAAAYNAEIKNLINGFREHNGDSWSADSYDDDLGWAVIAFARCYQLTGAGICLTDAENNLATVWSRGHASNGGIYWNSACESSCSSWYENSAANYTFVIASFLLYGITDNSTYHTEGDDVQTWANDNLYDSSTGEIYDGVNSTGILTGPYSYNYGIAIGAAAMDGKPTIVSNIANYLMYDLPNYAETYDGYNILPNYGQGVENNDGGFNGIAMRWIGVANAKGYVSSTVLDWAQANVGHAWALSNSTGLSWDDWVDQTPNSSGGAPYSWDCSDTVVGLFDIPAPAD